MGFVRGSSAYGAVIPGIGMAACTAESPGLDSRANTVEEWSVGATPILTIGADEASAEYLFESVIAVRLLGDERFVVADRAPAVRVFDRDGEFLQSIGRVGEGPGEFEGAAGIWLVPPDTIHVYDLRQVRIASFLVDGTPLETVGMERAGHPDQVVGGLRDGSFVLSWLDYGSGEAALVPDRVSLGRWRRDGTYLGLISQRSGALRYQREATHRPGSVFISHPFSPWPRLAMWKDTIHYTNGLKEIALLTEDGDKRRVLSIPVAEKRVEAAEVELQRSLMREGREILTEGVPEVDSIPRVAGMIVDAEGMIWVQKYDPARHSMRLDSWLSSGGGQWWIMNRNGEIVAEVMLPDGFVPHDVRGDLMIGVAMNEFDVQSVTAYELNRGS